MATTSSIGRTQQTQEVPVPAPTPKSDGMGRDAFLKLLVTQLAHQDPTQPQADGEFLAQLAQFSSLEQLTGIQSSLEKIGGALGVDMSGAAAVAQGTPSTQTATRQTAL